MKNDVLDRVIIWFGSQAEMARRLECAPAFLCRKIKEGGLTGEHAIRVEELSGGFFKAADLVLRRWELKGGDGGEDV